jgi:hypothetical protein
MKAVSFLTDIAPMFAPFRGSMLWRLDLTNYEDVKVNANTIYLQISTSQMPPSPYDYFTPEQNALFLRWMAEGCQP